MKVTVRESAVVCPAQATPAKTVWTSNMDQVVRRVHNASLHFYRPNGSPNFFDTRVLKDALAQVLVPFYPLAGRLGCDDNGRLEIHCNGKGVSFMAAETESVMDDLEEFTQFAEFPKLVPAVDYSGGISSYPLLLSQVTFFKCGGVCLGVKMQHTVVDGASAFHFLNAWSEIARGLSMTTLPFLDRTLLRARHPPTPAFDHVEYHPPRSLNVPDLPEASTSTAVLKITLDQLNALKTTNADKTMRYSSYEFLVSHVWRCACRARGLPHNQATKLYVAVNGRSRLRPPLPPAYFGNAIFSATPVAVVGDLVTRPLTCTVEQVHAAISRMDDEYLRSALDYLDQLPEPMTAVRGAHYYRSPNLCLTSWGGLPVHDADFGWGRPIYVGPGSVPYEGTGYVLPSPTNDGSVTVTMCLERDSLKLFQKLLYEL